MIYGDRKFIAVRSTTIVLQQKRDLRRQGLNNRYPQSDIYHQPVNASKCQINQNLRQLFSLNRQQRVAESFINDIFSFAMLVIGHFSTQILQSLSTKVGHESSGGEFD